MNLTRRGLFGVLARVAAAAGLTKVVASIPETKAATPVPAKPVERYTFPYQCVTTTSMVTMRTSRMGYGGDVLVVGKDGPEWRS